jgi:signal transduction histidine kinase/ligand-binding sensor domain-containing protein/DNA-binding response OmpR family regulator
MKTSCAFFLYCCLLFVSPLLAQTGPAVSQIGIQNGLSNNVVTSIFQDSKGFVWVGTYDGLNRYDGYGITIYRNIIGDSTSLFSNNVNSVSEDAASNIWVANQKTLSIYNRVTGRFRSPLCRLAGSAVPHRLEDNVISLLPVGKTMFAGTQKSGLFRFGFSGDQVTGVQIPLIVNGRTSTTYYAADIARSPDQRHLYVLVQGEGLFEYDSTGQALRLVSPLAVPGNTLQADVNGDVWAGAESGLYRLPANSHTFETVTGSIAVKDITRGSDGNLWIATDGDGVWLLPPGTTSPQPLADLSPGHQSPVNSNSVYCIYEDKSRRKWIGTLRGGINILAQDAARFRKVVYNGPDKKYIVDNFIFSFCEDRDKNIWIGTDGAGLRCWNRSANTFRNFKHEPGQPGTLSSNFVTSILNDGANGLWLATWKGGINRFNPRTGRFRQYPCLNTETHAVNENVWALLNDSHNRLWAAAVRNGGLYRYNAHADRFDLYDGHLKELQCLAEDRSGNLWGGDYASLIRLDTLTRRHQFYTIGNVVRCIFEDHRHRFWIGTQEGGLLLFNRETGTCQRFTTSQGLPHNTVLRILEDSRGDLWLSTYNGLSRFDPARQQFTNYTQADGLQSNQFSFQAALLLSGGDMLFGGIDGFNIFNPLAIPEKRLTGNLLLSGLTVNNSPIGDHPAYIKQALQGEIRQVELPYNDASVSLDFVYLDNNPVPGVEYAYFLEGWDKHWNYVQKGRRANYSSLREGTYTFKVKASYSEGEWGKEEQLLVITVLPPWYRTRWAYTLYALLAVGLLLVYVLYNNRQARLRYQVQLARVEMKNEKELNERKIDFFTNISHEFRAPLSLIINPLKDALRKEQDATARRELTVVYRNAQRLLRLVDQLLLFKKADVEEQLHTQPLHYANLCREVFDCFTEQARTRQITYTFSSNEQGLLVAADKEKIEIALFNILSNAFKHTPDKGTISFEVKATDGQVTTIISDSGIGIPAGEGSKLFERFYQVKGTGRNKGFGIGLYLVKKFVDAHQGTITYQSARGHGTSFCISLPAVKPLASEESPVQEPDQTAPALPQPPAAGDSLLQEMNGEIFPGEADPEAAVVPGLVTDKKTLLLIDDDNEIIRYLSDIFAADFRVLQANDAVTGIELAREHLPDLIISDIMMQGLNGLDMCKTLKDDEAVSHIPIILLTGTASEEMQLKSLEMGADDFIRKPFDKDLLMARVKAILNRQNVLQKYFYNEVTLGSARFKVSAEYKAFLQECMKIIEEHIDDEQFSIKVLAKKLGMSHSKLYRKVKSMSGQSINGFIRFIRLKKAAELLIHTEYNISETALMVGFNDAKYFRLQFARLFGINPSDYIKKYRKAVNNVHNLENQLRK